MSGKNELIDAVFVTAQRATRLSFEPNQSSADMKNSVPPRDVTCARFGDVPGWTEYQQ